MRIPKTKENTCQLDIISKRGFDWTTDPIRAMHIIDKHTIAIDVNTNVFDVNVIKGRRNYLHQKLGYVCIDCGVGCKKGRKGMLHMHHIFYPLGYEQNWSYNWQHASDDVFYSSYYPEIMEACVLLCRKCHKKRHGIGKAN